MEIIFNWISSETILRKLFLVEIPLSDDVFHENFSLLFAKFFKEEFLSKKERKRKRGKVYANFRLPRASFLEHVSSLFFGKRIKTLGL